MDSGTAGGFAAGEESGAGRPVGFSARDDPFTGDRWTDGEEPEAQGEVQQGARTPEQEAADLLMQAEADQGMEPDYDFESAEGGNASPSLEILQNAGIPGSSGLEGQGEQRAQQEAAGQGGGSPRLSSTLRGSGHLSHGNSQPGDQRFREQQRDSFVGQTEESGLRYQHGDPLAGRAVDRGLERFQWDSFGAVNGNSGLQGVDRGVRRGNDWGASLFPGRGRGSTNPTQSESERVDVLEALVHQLLEQNEQMRREMSDVQSVSSGESGRGRVGPVQKLRRRTEDSESVGEGRGSGRTGEQRNGLGKGIGGSNGDRWAPTLRTFQPPWTTFGHEHASLASSLPAEGPGDKYLAATRALQSLTLQEASGFQMMGTSQLAVDPSSSTGRPMSGNHQSFPMPDSSSAAGIPSFSGTDKVSVTGKGVGQGGVVSKHSGAAGASAENALAPPSSMPGTSQGVEGSRVVTVMINGVPRKGMFNEQGEVVIASESPKFFAIQDNDDDAGECAPNILPRGNVPEEQFVTSAPPLVSVNNPFSAKASSPFRSNAGERSPERPQPPPPPPPVDLKQGIPTRQVYGNRSGYPRRPSRSPNPSPPRAPALRSSVNASPATPGGTKVPPGPPPQTPSVPVGEPERVDPEGAIQGAVERGLVGGSRDFVPGDRTIWDLPTLSPPSSEPNPAMRCNDWIYKVTPLMSDLAPRAHLWWEEVLKEAREEYHRWSVAKPLERARLLGKPSATLMSEVFVRLESRGVAMLSKALPNAVYEQALSNRNVTCTGLIFLALRTYQPGGLNERAELLRGLTNLSVFDSAVAGVGGLQKWFRHLERASAMNISVPDSSLLLDSLDKSLTTILAGNPSMNFRMHTVRMQLQLDTRPVQETVLEYARTVLAELELLAVAAPESSQKRQKVAALGTDQTPIRARGWASIRMQARARKRPMVPQEELQTQGLRSLALGGLRIRGVGMVSRAPSPTPSSVLVSAGLVGEIIRRPIVLRQVGVSIRSLKARM